MPEPKGPSPVEVLLAKAREVEGDPTRFTGYANDPVGFTRDVLGVKIIWGKLEEALLSVRDYRRVTIRSGHGVGKSFTMACIVLWWLYARVGRVITTASTWDQVEDVLWGEINDLAAKAKTPLPGIELQTERRIDNVWYAKGLSTNKPTAFQGRHHPRLLVVIDEAAGVEEPNHIQIATLATGGQNHIVMVGNPTEVSGTFYDSFKHPDIWHPIHISCFDHPNVIQGEELIPGAVTRAWIEERRVFWGPKHPLWYSRVLGEFPLFSDKGVIPLVWAERAQDVTRWTWDESGEPIPDPHGQTYLEHAHERALELKLKPIIALDVARYGQCKCVMGLRYGDAVASIDVWDHESTMETCGRVVKLWRATQASMVVVDESGVGGGVVDRLMEQNEVPVFGYNSGHRAFTPGQYSNRRSELWWLVRMRLERNRLFYPPTPELIRDLVAPTYEVKSSGRTQVETKEHLLERGIKSPDYADMLVMLFADSDPIAFEEELKHEPGEDPQAYEEEYGTRDPNPFPQLPAGF